MTNGKKDTLDQIRGLLKMTAAQTAENARQIKETSKQLQWLAKEHNREMKEIRSLFKDMIKRIAA